MNHLTDDPRIADLLSGVRVGTARRHGGLTVRPLLGPAGRDPGWLLLDEAVAAGTLEVTEVSDAGRVPNLIAANVGATAVLLLDGEELVGAKQNRVLNTTVLIGPGQRVTIPVSCVEQGRWAYRSHRFAASGHSLYASVRRKKAAQVHDSLLADHTYRTDQSRVWNDLSERAYTLGVSSATGAMRDVFAARKEGLAAYSLALAPEPTQIGALVYGGREWWGLDLLASPRLFARAWNRLLTGYAMDALLIDRSEELAEPATEPLAAMSQVQATAYPSLGLGEEYRFLSKGLVGAALVVDETVAHLMAFPT
jgi:hypothetical protein